MSDFSKVNLNRCKKGFKHPLETWSTSDWMVATVGELGEAANILKKMNRLRDDIKANNEHDKDLIELIKRFRSELADVFIYLDLMCQASGISLQQAVIDTFNAKSKELKLKGEEFYLQ